MLIWHLDISLTWFNLSEVKVTPRSRSFQGQIVSGRLWEVVGGPSTERHSRCVILIICNSMPALTQICLLFLQVSCRGNETDIGQCRFREGECTQQKYVSVFCSRERIDEQAGRKLIPAVIWYSNLRYFVNNITIVLSLYSAALVLPVCLWLLLCGMPGSIFIPCIAVAMSSCTEYMWYGSLIRNTRSRLSL